MTSFITYESPLYKIKKGTEKATGLIVGKGVLTSLKRAQHHLLVITIKNRTNQIMMKTKIS
jgi:hypothetical protein